MQRKPINLTLSDDAINFSNKLKKPMRQRSRSGVVEALIVGKAVALNLPGATKFQEAKVGA